MHPRKPRRVGSGSLHVSQPPHSYEGHTFPINTARQASAEEIRKRTGVVLTSRRLCSSKMRDQTQMHPIARQHSTAHIHQDNTQRAT